MRPRQGAATRATAGLLVVSLLAPAPTSAAPAGEHGALQDASTRYAEAQGRLDAGDHDGAIVLLETGLAEVPEGSGYAPTRARMLLRIVEANEAGFAADGELERLRRARRLLDRYLGPLDLLDEQGRGEAEERRSRLITQIVAVEEARQRADDARAADARRERAELARRHARRLTIAGAATLSIGAAALAVMGGGLGLGRSADARIDALAEQYVDDPCVVESAACEERYQAFQDERRRGNSGNLMFVGGAAVGGVLLVSGVTLLLVARKRGREARALQVTPTLGRAGVGLVLTGRF